MYRENTENKIDVQIALAIAALGLLPNAFTKCERDRAEQIIQRVKDIFVVGEPQRWLASLKTPKTVVGFRDGGFRHLLEYVPMRQERCWFIPGNRSLPYTVYDAETQYITDILGNCYAFEYYLVGKDFGWLLAEDDEDQLIISFVQPH